MIQFSIRQQHRTRNDDVQHCSGWNNRLPCFSGAVGAMLLAALGCGSMGCRSHLLNAQLGADFDRSMDVELVESSARNESRAGSSVRPHPLTQRLRPGGAAPSPTDRKQTVTRRNLQRPLPENDSVTEGETGSASDKKSEELLRDYARGTSDSTDSSSLEAQRERIEGEIRRRQSRSSAAAGSEERERAVASHDDKGEMGMPESTALTESPSRRGEAMVFSLSDNAKPIGIRRIDMDVPIPDVAKPAPTKKPAVPTKSAPTASRNGARVRFTDRDASSSKTNSVEQLLGPVVETQTANPVISASHNSSVREPGPESELHLSELEQRDESSVGNVELRARESENTNIEASRELGPTELIQGLFAQLDQEYAAATNPQTRINIEKKKRLLSMVADDIQSATSPIDGLQPEAQEYIQKTLTALYDATDEAGHPSMTRRLTRALESHREAANELARVASLRVVSPAFCTEVDSFGVVKKFDSYSFQQDQEVLLYCELENFASKKLGGGFETRLQGSYEIINAQGDTVLEQVLPEDSDVCANQRRDFYIAYRLFMPVRIEPGAYQLKLYIEDIHGKKFGQAEIDFRIAEAK